MNALLLRGSCVRVVSLCAVLITPSVLSSQVTARPEPARPNPALVRQNRAALKANRAVVDKLQQRVDVMVRDRLSLTDDQFNKLRALNNRLEVEKRDLRVEEAKVRRALREETLPGVTPNDAKVAELLDKLPVVERKRIALQEREQKELSAFMQPGQRARYFALQDELRRSLQEVQRKRGGVGDSTGLPLRPGARGLRPPPGGPPPGAIKR